MSTICLVAPSRTLCIRSTMHMRGHENKGAPIIWSIAHRALFQFPFAEFLCCSHYNYLKCSSSVSIICLWLPFTSIEVAIIFFSSTGIRRKHYQTLRASTISKMAHKSTSFASTGISQAAHKRAARTRTGKLSIVCIILQSTTAVGHQPMVSRKYSYLSVVP